MKEIFERIGSLVWYVVLAFTFFLIVGVPIYEHGFIGWFLGFGVICTSMVLLMFVSALLNWIVKGVFDFNPDFNKNENNDKAVKILRAIKTEMPRTMGEPNFDLLYKDVCKALELLEAE